MHTASQSITHEPRLGVWRVVFQFDMYHAEGDARYEHEIDEVSAECRRRVLAEFEASGDADIDRPIVIRSRRWAETTYERRE